MPKDYDGSIIVDTEIDATGFKAGSEKVKNAVDSLGAKAGDLNKSLAREITKFYGSLESSGDLVNKALSGDEKALERVTAKASESAEKLEQYKARLNAFGQQRFESEDYKYQLDQWNKAVEKRYALQEKLDKMPESVGKNLGRQNIEGQIEALKKLEAEYEQAMMSMRSNGTAFYNGSETEEFRRMKEELDAAETELRKMEKAAKKLHNPLRGAAKIIKSGIVKTLRANARLFMVPANALQSLVSRLHKANKGTSKLSKNFQRFKRLLGTALVFSGIYALINGLKEGMKNLAQYSPEVNKSISGIMSATAQLKNSIATAFAPLLNAVAPTLTRIINLMSEAATKLGMFFAAMTGAKTFIKAKSVQVDYAESLRETAEAADEAKNQLASFDELNVLSDSSSKNKSADASTDIGDMFETVPIDSKIKGFVDKIKRLFRDEDYAGIGRMIGGGINRAFQTVNDYISWDRVGGTVTKYVNAFCDIFNNMLYAVDWDLIGRTFASGVNTIVNTAYLLLTGIDFLFLGQALFTALNAMIRDIDWYHLGETVGAAFMAVLNFLYGAVTTFDFGQAGRSLAAAITGIIDTIDWAKLGLTLSAGIIGIFTFIRDFIAGIDWQQLGRDVATFVANIDYSGIAKAFYGALGAVLGGIAGFIFGLISEAFERIKDQVQEKAEEHGGNLVLGLLEGIKDAVIGFPLWIYENIVEPFLDAFKEAFGIHSPSTVMAEQGGYLVEGLLQGILDAWAGIPELIGGLALGVVESVSGAWENAKNWTSEKWGAIKASVSGTWNSLKSDTSKASAGIGSTVSGAWNTLKNTTSQQWSNIKSTISGTWGSVKANTASESNNLKSSLSSTWNSIKNTASSSCNGMKSQISGAWRSVHSDAVSSWRNISSALSSTWNNISSIASSASQSIKNVFLSGWQSVGSNICSGIIDGINSGWNWLQSAVSNVASNLLQSAKNMLGIHSPSRIFRDEVGLNIGYGIGEGVEKATPSVLGAVSDVANAIAAEMNAGNYAIKTVVPTAEVDGAITNFADKITDGFTSMLDRLQAIADNITFSAPAVAGGVIPYKLMTVDSAPSGNGGENIDGLEAAIDASNEELGSVIIQSVTNATVAIVDAIRENSGTTVNLDTGSITSGVIEEINRRTKMTGKSPLLV